MSALARRILLRSYPRYRGAISLLVVALAIAVLASAGVVGRAAALPGDTGGVVEDPPEPTPTPTPTRPPRRPLDGVAVDPDDLEGVLVEDTPVPTVAPTTAPQPTAAPTTEPTDAPTTTPTTEPATAAQPTEGPSGQPNAGQATAPPPDAASLTIVLSTCAPGYDLFAADADPAEDCPGPTDGVPFSLTGNDTDATRSTGEDGAGTAIFADLAPDTYRLVEQLPTGVDFAFVLDCTSNVRSFDSPFLPFAMAEPNGTFGVTLEAEEDLVCAWYHVPSNEPATVTVTLHRCTGTAVSPTACPVYAGGLGLTLSPTDDSAVEETIVTDGNGVASFAVTGGTYILTEEGGIPWCIAESDAFDEKSNLVVTGDQGGQSVKVTIYNCGGQP